MRLTALLEGRTSGAGRRDIPAPITSKGTSIPAPIGGWDTMSPISDMPPQNAVELVNWFPQPGWVELRRGFIDHSDTGTGLPVESIMAYQGATANDDRLFAASDGTIWEVDSAASASSLTGLGNDRWQSVNFAGSGGTFLWICNGEDTPRFWDGTNWTTATITGVTPEDMVSCTIYRNRIWTVLKDSTKAAYLPLDSVQGLAHTFELGGYFSMGGYLQAIAAWSTDVQSGTNEFIVFISSYGETAIFLIYDPSAGDGFAFRGVASLGSPIGRRCVERIGSDLGVITLDGVFPLSQIINYDRAAMQAAAITKNIRSAMTDAARDFGSQFGWQLLSYPLGNMAILNVPIVEGAQQVQFVMNTITGAWCRFEGQSANCWETYHDRAYFGGNDGVVRLADEAAGDENQTLTFDMQCAYNYYASRGQNKRWTTLRPLITKDSTYSVNAEIGLSIDFQLNNALDDTVGVLGSSLAIWDDPNTKWNEAMWPGRVTTATWLAISGIGYCASIRIKGSVDWTADPSGPVWILAEGIWNDNGIWIDTAVWIDTPTGIDPNAPTDSLFVPQVLRVNSFDVLYSEGAFI